jgi:hypothetical protein
MEAGGAKTMITAEAALTGRMEVMMTSKVTWSKAMTVEVCRDERGLNFFFHHSHCPSGGLAGNGAQWLFSSTLLVESYTWGQQVL